MTPHEYEKAKKRVEPQRQVVMNLKPTHPNYEKQLQKYTEMLITVKGHAWCMDVASERRKVAKLVSSAVAELLRNRGV